MNFKKKFKVRVKHFSESYYSIEYAYYRFICLWNEIPRFSESLEGTWTHVFIDGFERAEKVASKFKNIHVVKSYIKQELQKEAENKIKMKEMQRKIQPYVTKIIVKP